MPKISVVVPVYNVRDYLEKCVDSVLSQTFRDWELILVNDGSKDGSGDLCGRLSGRDRRIRVLDLPNRGVGAARNAGIDIAAGEYLAFLDSDDSYAPEHLETLLDLAERTGADVAAVGAVVVDEEGTTTGVLSLPPSVTHEKEESLRTFLCRGRALYACWNKLFRKSVVGDTRFSRYSRAEDALFCVSILLRAGTYAVSEKKTYRYLQRAGSVTSRPSSASLRDQLLAWQEIYGMLPGEAPDLSAFVAAKICRDTDTICRPLLKAGQDDRRLTVALHNEFYPLQFGPGPLHMKKRLAALIYRLSPELYYGFNRSRIRGRRA